MPSGPCRTDSASGGHDGPPGAAGKNRKSAGVSTGLSDGPESGARGEVRLQGQAPASLWRAGYTGKSPCLQDTGRMSPRREARRSPARYGPTAKRGRVPVGNTWQDCPARIPRTSRSSKTGCSPHGPTRIPRCSDLPALNPSGARYPGGPDSGFGAGVGELSLAELALFGRLFRGFVSFRRGG